MLKNKWIFSSMSLLAGAARILRETLSGTSTLHGHNYQGALCCVMYALLIRCDIGSRRGFFFPPSPDLVQSLLAPLPPSPHVLLVPPALLITNGDLM